MGTIAYKIDIKPIGTVYNNRHDVEDDNWGDVISTIQLDVFQFDGSAIKELSSFSHIEVIFYFHLVSDDKIVWGARHPRNNKSFPLTGIFAQRGKNRPNRIGATKCKILAVDESQLTIKVQGLDAINGTPVLDIKPCMKEFDELTDIVQPAWSHEIMKNYW